MIFESFSQKARQRYANSTKLVNVSVADQYESVYPDAWGAGVSVELENGDVLHSGRNKCKGDPDMPITRVALIEKAKMLMAYGGMDATGSESLINNLLATAGDEMLLNKQILDVLS